MSDATRDGLLSERRAVPADWQAIRALRLRARAVDPQAFRTTLDQERQAEEAQSAERVARGASSPTEAIWVALADSGELVGMSGIASEGQSFRIWGMWVAPEFRKQGLGSRLLEHLVAWARAVRPTAAVKLEVNPSQGAAAHLYESRGFVATGRTTPLGHTPGAVLHEMVLRLPSRSEARP